MTTSDVPLRATLHRSLGWLSLSFALTVAAWPVAGAAAEPSKEDVANAKAAAKEGRELREKGKYKEALAKFEAAWAYVQTPLTGRDLAQELERDGKLVEARLVWSEVAKMSAKPGTPRSTPTRARSRSPRCPSWTSASPP